ncbi:flagellar export protein FliJ [Hydrogenophaga taeniospiralis]|jgi:flagellar FliJ protein|uniref:flagellar export protein FliJ n=1 Tax=Hydrogenophaga taeniospiralis TaxID=65656 RepID=UPI001CF98BA2|nr:flagellar export protein FliJ [Hydrogenophaga taeniospiralis]MCB4366819.1 flagellar export protein FliJ [Hydrogenophaga taeniospiralis]
MSNMKTLNKVVELAEKRRDEALAALAQLQRELQMAREQMVQLESYAQEAMARWSARSSVGVDANLLHHHRQFMQKIDHAMNFQARVLQDREAMIERGQSQLHAAERDVAGLRRFAERKQQAIDHRAQRLDQKNTDEMALTIHLRQSLAQAQLQGVRS